MQNTPKFLLNFHPESWSRLQYLRRLIGPSIQINDDTKTGLISCEGHLQKAEVFKLIANQLIPELPREREELVEHGYSPGTRSSQFAALSEEIICELYSAIDGMKTFIYGAHRNVNRIQKRSNEQLFKRAKERSYGPEFPEVVRNILADAWDVWFQTFRKLRTELTHGQVGSCFMHSDGKVTYINPGLGPQDNALVIKDFITEINSYIILVTELIEKISDYFTTLLEPRELHVLCGSYNSRVYLRAITTKPKLSFSDGKCLSWTWFDKEDSQRCPLADKCQAYANRDRYQA